MMDTLRNGERRVNPKLLFHGKLSGSTQVISNSSVSMIIVSNCNISEMSSWKQSVSTIINPGCVGPTEDGTALTDDEANDTDDGDVSETGEAETDGTLGDTEGRDDGLIEGTEMLLGSELRDELSADTTTLDGENDGLLLDTEDSPDDRLDKGLDDTDGTKLLALRSDWLVEIDDDGKEECNEEGDETKGDDEDASDEGETSELETSDNWLDSELDTALEATLETDENSDAGKEELDTNDRPDDEMMELEIRLETLDGKWLGDKLDGDKLEGGDELGDGLLGLTITDDDRLDTILEGSPLDGELGALLGEDEGLRLDGMLDDAAAEDAGETPELANDDG
jgi:hypothetical protein